MPLSFDMLRWWYWMVLSWSPGPCESCWVRFVVSAHQKFAVICLTIRPIILPDDIHRANQFHAHNHAINSWHAQMMILNGFELITWPMWVMLGQICGQCSPKIGSGLPNFNLDPLSYQMTSIEPTNSMLIHAIIFWHAQMMMIINGFDEVIWPMWVMLGQICGQGWTKISPMWVMLGQICCQGQGSTKIGCDFKGMT
jgi:hypothetical protein